MRKSTAALAFAIALVGCAVPAIRASRLPPALHELTLVDDHPQISSVRFPHALHVDPEIQGRHVACAECHHDVRNDPEAVPQRCTTCHEFAYLTDSVDEPEPHDESKPHEHGLPPDL